VALARATFETCADFDQPPTGCLRCNSWKGLQNAPSVFLPVGDWALASLQGLNEVTLSAGFTVLLVNCRPLLNFASALISKLQRYFHET